MKEPDVRFAELLIVVCGALAAIIVGILFYLYH